MNNLLKQFTNEIVTEEFGRGVSDYEIDQIVDDTSDSIKRIIKKFVDTTSISPAERRERLQASKAAIDEIEDEMKILLKNKLSAYMRNY